MSRRPVSTVVFEGLSLVSFTFIFVQTQAGIIGTKGYRPKRREASALDRSLASAIQP
jgi:hypothetical protein